MKTVTVLVPKAGTPAALRIDAGSGIVANLEHPNGKGGGCIEVYYEGNSSDAEHLREFKARVLHAAGRLEQRYPTLKRGLFDLSDFVPVGLFSWTNDWGHTRLDLTNQELVERWTTS